MKIQIRVKTGQKINKVEYLKEEDKYIVSTKAQGRENKANLSVIDILADYFDVIKSSIKIVSGFKSKDKVVEIESD